MIKVCYCTVYFAPYRDYTLQKLSEYNDIELTILSDNDKWLDHTEWHYDHPNLSIIYTDEPVSILKRNKFDIYVFTGTLNKKIVAWCMIHKKKYIYQADTICEERDTFYPIKHFIKKCIINQSQAVMVPGKLGRMYQEGMVSDKNKIFEGIYTFDNEALLNQIESSKNDIDVINMRKRIANRFTFLFVGKLIKSRRVGKLIKAFKGLDMDVFLIIIGDGEESYLVQEFINEKRNIQWIPRCSFNDLHKYYYLSDAYVHPGEEPYSLATIEAAIAGMPIVASNKVGAVHDCLIHNFNGCVFDGDEKKLLVAMSKIIQEHERYVKGAKIIQNKFLYERSIDWAADQMYQAIVYR